MGVTFTDNSYAGEVLDNFLMQLTTGFETVAGGHVHVKSGIMKDMTIPRIKGEDLFQDRAATPVSKGSMTHTERKLSPQDWMLYFEFNPRDYEAFWKPFQPSGTPLVFRSLAPEVQSAFLEEILKYSQNWMETAIWQGDQSTAPTGAYRYFDGLITKALADSGVIDIGSPVALTDANIQAKEKLVYDALPLAVKRNPNMKMFISDATAELHTDAVHNQSNKGNDFTQAAPLSYKGKRLVSLPGIPDNTIFATHSTAGRDSNLFFGIDWDIADMQNALLIDKVAPNSELYFIKGNMKADTQIGWGEECVLYKV